MVEDGLDYCDPPESLIRQKTDYRSCLSLRLLLERLEEPTEVTDGHTLIPG